MRLFFGIWVIVPDDHFMKYLEISSSFGYFGNVFLGKSDEALINPSQSRWEISDQIIKPMGC